MKRHLFIIFCLGTLFGTLAAQQAPQYSLYMQNPLMYNPAYAGMEPSLSVTGIYRTQWVQLAGQPVSQTVSAHLPLAIISSGIGIQLDNESLGATNQLSGMIAYSYQREINRRGVLSVGIGVGITQRGLDGSLLRTPEGIYSTGEPIDHNDPQLPVSNQQTTYPTFRAGLFWQAEKLEMGIGLINILEPTLKFPIFDLSLERSYFLTVTYLIEAGKKLQIEPSVLLKSDIFQTQAEVSALFRYNGNFFVGTSYRGFTATSQDALIFLGGFNVNEKWTISYAYDWTLSALRAVNSGSHEIALHFNLGKKIGNGVPPKIIFNPRF